MLINIGWLYNFFFFAHGEMNLKTASQTLWKPNTFILIAISMLLLVLTSPDLQVCCVLWYQCIWLALMLNISHMFRMLAEVKVFEMLNFFWSRCSVMIFFLVFSGPNFSKLAWIVLLKILMHLKDLNVESEPKVLDSWWC